MRFSLTIAIASIPLIAIAVIGDDLSKIQISDHVQVIPNIAAGDSGALMEQAAGGDDRGGPIFRTAQQQPLEPSPLDPGSASGQGLPSSPGTAGGIGSQPLEASPINQSQVGNSSAGFSGGALPTRISAGAKTDSLATSSGSSARAATQGGNSTQAAAAAASPVVAVTQAMSTATSSLATTAPVDLVTPSTVQFQGSSDVGRAVVESSTAQTVQAKRRSPLSVDTRIRGFQGGQIMTTQDGANWIPIRPDMDAMLSKVDPYLIGQINVISGPYGLRYGPGFSFLAAETIPTFRYEDGPESHVRIGSTFHGNGDQWYNRATLYGGGEGYGYIFNYGNRTGVDYEAGNGLDIPSSYQAQDIYGSFGFDLDKDTRLELRYHRLDQTDTEYAGQFFDVDFLGSNGFSSSLIRRNEEYNATYRFDAWYNESDMFGDTEKPGKRRADFPVLQRVDRAIALFTNNGDPNNPARLFSGNVNGENSNAGLRMGASVVDGDRSLSMGVDARYVQQTIRENYNVVGIANGDFSTRLPDSYTLDPGLYLEGTLGLSPDWLVAAGGRIDFAKTSADLEESDLFRNQDVPDSTYDTLLAGYLTNDIILTNHSDIKLGVGYAERTPDLTDRYSDGLFLAVIQNGFSRVIGNPNLDKERNLQADARLNVHFDDVRVRLTGFHSWVYDYITYKANLIDDPLGARLLETTNTDLATLTGGEGYIEIDWLDWLQGFAAINYLEGRDQTIGRALAGISPLESRIGFRLLDPSNDTRWGFEAGVRIVDNQDRLSEVRPQAPAVDFIRLENATPGFTTTYLKAFLRPKDGVNIIAGIDNLGDRAYFEHLDLRLPASGPYGETIVYAPGITPYIGVEVDY